MAGGTLLTFIVLSASLVAMCLRNRKIYRESSVLKEQNEAELELGRIGVRVESVPACVWGSQRASHQHDVCVCVCVCVSVRLCVCVAFHSLPCTAGLRFTV